ncbi:RHS repeat-associated core domain-containing protein [Pseudomonas sp. NBRC 111123]|uniref:RHS repeat-associated core domain-containing protein n=1 Tax=Pseudomonas sp. NBRC 111123 TaxID=1661038 RepID=UPI0009EC925B
MTGRSHFVSALAYTPFGFCHPRCVALTIGFNGQKKDPQTNLYSLGNGRRYYSAALMRFLTPDALSPFNEGGINNYVYCGADPVNLMDPSGQAPQSKIPVLIKGHTFTKPRQKQPSPAKSKIPRPIRSSSARATVQEWHWDDPEIGLIPQSLEWDYPDAGNTQLTQLLRRNRHTFKIAEDLDIANLHLDLIELDIRAIKSWSIHASDANSLYIHNLQAISRAQIAVGAVEAIRNSGQKLSIYGILGRFHNN